MTKIIQLDLFYTRIKFRDRNSKHSNGMWIRRPNSCAIDSPNKNIVSDSNVVDLYFPAGKWSVTHKLLN